MSMYGPPGGGQYPGQPQDPWQGGSGGDPYGGQPGGDPYGGQASSPFGGPPGGDPYGGQPSGPPADPYGGQPSGPPADPYGGQPSGPPADPYGGGQWGGQPPGGAPGAPWGPPGGPPPAKSNTGLIVGISAVVVLVLLIGVVGVFLFMSDDSSENRAGGDPTPTSEAPTSAEPSETETSEAPTDEPTKYDLNDAEEGDCLYDSDPSDTSASLTFVSCDERGEDYYRVLKRFDNTTDASKCKDVEGYDSSFTSSTGRFVLCVEELV